MATTLPRTGVVIVGVGAAGGVAALPLAAAGIDVVGLEAGSWLNTRDMVPDELRLQRGAWPPGPQKVDGEVPSSRPNAAASATRGTNHPMMNGVGGTAMHYMAQAWRLNPWDFKVVSETSRRYGRSRIPAGSTVEDWPLTYEDLEPSYDRVEYQLGVSGTAGNIKGTKIEAGNIFEGARQREYPMPALRSTGFMDKMSGAARSLGLHPFTGPAAITSRPYDGRSACVYHGFCIGAGCHVNAKSSPAVSTIPKAQKTGRFQVVTESHVTRIDVDRDGRATGVTYVQGNAEFLQPADVVLVASQTYKNVRLLLLSKSAAFPNGLSNNHGQVGRHYFSHAQFGGVAALFPFDLRNWYGTPGQGVCVDNWADDNFDHSGLDFIGGGTMYVYSERRPMAAVNGLAAWGRQGPNWGSDWKAHVIKNADRTNAASLQKTTLPYEGNDLDLDPVEKDPLGNPVIRITASFRENEQKISGFVGEKMRQWYLEAGAVQVQGTGIINAGTAMGTSTHAYGGTRMGRNPETNVANEWGMSHEVPNLGIMGGSVMGTSGARNPTLTLQALAWRTADYVAPELEVDRKMTRGPIMLDARRALMTSMFLVAMTLAAAPAFSQADLSGVWGARYQEDQPERIPGPPLVDYIGLPMSDAARQWALSWDPLRLGAPEHQCQVHTVAYIYRGPLQLRIWEERDPETQQVVAIKQYINTYEQERTIWMDGRPHPSANAPHTWMGFSTGEWNGSMLTVTTTHIKQGWHRRNGFPSSDRMTLREHFVRHGDQLVHIDIVQDPDYLTEPLIKTQNFVLTTTGAGNWLWPCEYVVESADQKQGDVPHYLPGKNPFVDEFAKRHGLPVDATLGGPKTMYPEYQKELSDWYKNGGK